ncbi:MAG: pseudouridine synthase [Eubacteriales bacterium]|nr:pseudouridine synthase [Eubacteriales bacterium]
MKAMRLDKYLTKAEGMSRSEAKQILKKGRVTLDGERVTRPETKIDAETAKICVDGRPCVYEEYTYLMFYKPKGLITATEDAREKTVTDWIGEDARGLFPVGRLDKDTEGLLLLTNDGAMAHELLAPGRHVDKRYYAVLDGAVGEKEQKQFAQGLDIGEKRPTMPAVLEPALDGSEKYAVYITIKEGKYHQIKRMAKAVGRKVLYLKRVSMGSLTLAPELSPGQYRPLTEKELAGLIRLTRLERS